MPDIQIDFASLDYRCDPRVFGRPDESGVDLFDDAGNQVAFLYQGALDGQWVLVDVVDAAQPVIGVYGCAEEAVYSVLDLPVPSAYIKDPRVQPIGPRCRRIGWDEGPERFFLDDGNGNEYEVQRFGPDAGPGMWSHANPECWVAWSSSGGPHNEFDLLDDAFRACLGEPDRAWNAED